MLLIISCNFLFIDPCNLNRMVSGSLLPHGGSVLNMQGQSNIEMMPRGDSFGVAAWPELDLGKQNFP